MDLTTKYLGMKLRSPLVPSASPLSEDLDNIKRMEDAGAAALVLHSLFEEQIRHETQELEHHLSYNTESFAESLTFFPEPERFVLHADEYLEHIRKAQEAVDIPVIASLNATSPGSWTEFATLIEGAGANAIELNIYHIETEPGRPGSQVEDDYIDILTAVEAAVDIPVAVKASPFFSNFANMAKRFDDAGADALVLFNRFYQPDIDLNTFEVVPRVMLSTPMAMRLPMRWVAILYGQLQGDLAATSGIHKAPDVIKMVMAGASVTLLCSVLLKNGIQEITEIEKEMVQWMEENEYESVTQMLGSMSQKNCANPTAFERTQYMKALTSFKPQHL